MAGNDRDQTLFLEWRDTIAEATRRYNSQLLHSEKPITEAEMASILMAKFMM